MSNDARAGTSILVMELGNCSDMSPSHHLKILAANISTMVATQFWWNKNESKSTTINNCCVGSIEQQLLLLCPLLPAKMSTSCIGTPKALHFVLALRHRTLVLQICSVSGHCLSSVECTEITYYVNFK
jgi:hypothetical protein